MQGKGLGLRRGLMSALEADFPSAIDFFEAAPDNWIDVGGRAGRRFRALTERLPLVCHGLSLNLGGTAPLDDAFLRRVKQFLTQHGAVLYSEHLSFCADDGYLYDLLPIPFTEEAVRHVAARIRRVQEVLGCRLVVENASYYCAPGAEMRELEFILAVLNDADCELLLDVNNAYVNGVNHGYDAAAFIAALPTSRIRYLHVAGHLREADDLAIDTHGAPVADPVWALLAHTYAVHGVRPTLLERDYALPPLAELLDELASIGRLQRAAAASALAQA
ncbi:MAG TPA: DUF692 domain-containing protein [Gammaproteobacteria bacterium]|nr:DUF692 domain-containing protein [Gammaproteobacteria bacterium]